MDKSSCSWYNPDRFYETPEADMLPDEEELV
jgi:hypothetical protein